MAFSELSVFRNSDDKLMHIIPPGGYSYIYEGFEQTQKDEDSDSEEDKQQEPAKNKNEKQPEGEIRTKIKFNKYIFRFEDDDNILYDSTPDYFYSSTRDYKFTKTNDDDDDDDNDNEESEQHKAVFLKFEVIKFNTFVYSPFVLINKTNLPISFGEKKSKSAVISVSPNHSELFNPISDKKKKFSITTNNYDWADSFDITTLGMSGEAALQRLDNYNAQDKVINDYSSNKLNFGVLISNLGGQHSKTTAIKIVPRYVFVNN